MHTISLLPAVSACISGRCFCVQFFLRYTPALRTVVALECTVPFLTVLYNLYCYTHDTFACYVQLCIAIGVKLHGCLRRHTTFLSAVSVPHFCVVRACPLVTALLAALDSPTCRRLQACSCFIAASGFCYRSAFTLFYALAMLFSSPLSWKVGLKGVRIRVTLSDSHLAWMPLFWCHRVVQRRHGPLQGWFPIRHCSSGSP